MIGFQEKLNELWFYKKNCLMLQLQNQKEKIKINKSRKKKIKRKQDPKNI